MNLFSPQAFLVIVQVQSEIEKVQGLANEAKNTPDVNVGAISFKV